MQDFALATGASIIGESERLKIGVDPKLGPNEQVRRARTGRYDGVQGLIREGTGCGDSTGCVDEDGQVRRGTTRCEDGQVRGATRCTRGKLGGDGGCTQTSTPGLCPENSNKNAILHQSEVYHLWRSWMGTVATSFQKN